MIDPLYAYKTKPYDHQKKAFEISRDLEFFAYLMEQGTGKSKVLIDVSAWLYGKGKINGMIVACPNGVVYNWANNELPTHMPDHVDYHAAVWRASPRKADKEALDMLWSAGAEGKFCILIINYEAFVGSKAKTFVRKFLNAFDVMFALDESHKIKTAGAQRTKSIRALGKYSRYRRILTGTSITSGPLNLFTQYSFLDNYIFPQSTMTAFRATYAEVVQRENRIASRKKGHPVYYDEIIGYRNIDQLVECIAPHSFRVKKSECLDLPDKIYEVRYVELTSTQKRMYEEMRRDAVAAIRGHEPRPNMTEEELLLWLLTDDEGKIIAANGGVKQLRMQQILGGYAPVGPKGEVQALDKTNPRISALIDVLEEAPGKVIIWARFRAEIAAIAEAIEKEYGADSFDQFHGGVDPEARNDVVARFQGKRAIIDPKTHVRTGWEEVPEAEQIRFFVGQPNAGGIGITLTEATTVVYFSNSYDYEIRAQSEDRAHRIGQNEHVTYIDIQAMGTIDQKIMGVLKERHETAEAIYEKLNNYSEGDNG